VARGSLPLAADRERVRSSPGQAAAGFSVYRWVVAMRCARASFVGTGARRHRADVGTLKRSDGTIQVTYKGHPLYLYVKDKDDGDTYGQLLKSFGAEWYTLTPTGAEARNPS
jgi:Secreted repeat of unknown function